jgi:hypothetical protein
MNVTCGTEELFKISRHWDGRNSKISSVAFRESVLDEKNTYWLIFNKDCFGNKHCYEFLVSYPGIKIVYQSRPAVNGNNGYRGLRNFLVVFEYEKPLQAVPEVPGQG